MAWKHALSLAGTRRSTAVLCMGVPQPKKKGVAALLRCRHSDRAIKEVRQ
jgi:hypothetical protein